MTPFEFMTELCTDTRGIRRCIVCGQRVVSHDTGTGLENHPTCTKLVVGHMKLHPFEIDVYERSRS